MTSPARSIAASDLPDPLGWFQIGWSEEIAVGGVKPIQICDQDLVAYRGETGRLHVLDGHCLHLGADLGRGGCVRGEELECPFHHWRWGPDGRNTHVPDLDRPHASARLSTWHVDERHGCIYLWHDPDGGAPRWPVVDTFSDLVGRQSESADDYYPPYPQGALRVEDITTHPRITADNIVDFRHFATVHGTGQPELREWKADNATFQSKMDFRAPRDGEVVSSLTLVLSGIGIVFTLQEGRMPQRVSLATTPTRSGHADLLLTTWLRRVVDDPSGTSEPVAKRYDAAAAALPQDIAIWRHQRFIERPLLAPYENGMAEFRRWARKFASTDSRTQEN